MFGWFKKKGRVVIPRHAADSGYRQVWQRKRLPGPGAMNMAFETLQLAQFPVSGPSIAVRDKMSVIQPQQLAVEKSVSIAGIPTTAGQVLGQPLFDPKSGMGIGVQPMNNVPYDKKGIAPAGAIW